MYSRIIIASIVPIFLLLAVTVANGQGREEGGISVLGFTTHKSATYEWNEERCARLQRMLTKALTERGLPMREIAYEFPESLSDASETRTLIEEVWTDLSRFHTVRYWLAGSVEIHKGGGSSFSLLLLDTRTRTVRRMDPVGCDAGSRERIDVAMPEIVADLAAHVETAVHGRE